jgi:hypothetical protein
MGAGAPASSRDSASKIVARSGAPTWRYAMAAATTATIHASDPTMATMPGSPTITLSPKVYGADQVGEARRFKPMERDLVAALLPALDVWSNAPSAMWSVSLRSRTSPIAMNLPASAVAFADARTVLVSCRVIFWTRSSSSGPTSWPCSSSHPTPTSSRLKSRRLTSSRASWTSTS